MLGEDVAGPSGISLCDRVQHVIVFMHPTTGIERPAFGQYTMLQLVGWPSETGLCVARLIFAGVFERHPGLKLVLADGSWVLYRLSGTEPVVRVYSEARSEADLEKLSAAAREWVFKN